MNSRKSTNENELHVTDSMLRVLRTWASVGAKIAEHSRPSSMNWEPVRRMIEAAAPKLEQDTRRLRELLAKSRNMFAPLEDPFDVDLGLHLWLDAEREEAYSDWLAWIVRQAKRADEVFKLFGLPTPTSEVGSCQQIEVERESRIAYGHEDREGRLDLVIRLGDKAMIVVEVKTVDADGADTDKHVGYMKWLERQSYPIKHSVLIASKADRDSYKGFDFISWASVCIEMRRLAVKCCGEKRVTTASMILAFVAAVEQNLLGFSAEFVKEACSGRGMLFNAVIEDHMERFIRQVEG